MFGRSRPDPPPDLSQPSPLASRLEEGIQAALQQVPPQYRPMARQLLPRLLTSLRSATDDHLRQGLLQVRHVIDGLLSEGGGGPP